MDAEQFIEFLDEHGIQARTSGKSIVVRDCPECGSSDYKVHFDRFSIKKRARQPNEPFMGRCYHGNCQTNYSSVSYLLKIGADKVRVMALHGMDPDTSLRGIIPEIALTEAKNTASAPPPEVTPDVSCFINMSAWLSHPAAKYAISRGARPEHYGSLMINPDANSIVFVVRENDKIVGYQERFLKPKNPKFKTKSSPGFTKTNHLLTFERSGAKIVVCEGPFTALAAHNYGYQAVCTFGSGVSDRQIELLVDMIHKTNADLGVAFDLDDAGKVGLSKIRNALYWKDMKIFRVVADTDKELPKGFDLNDAFQAGMRVKETTADEWLGPAIAELPRLI